MKEIKEGTAKLKSGIEQMPEEALKCLKEKFGDDIVDKIKSGNFTPNQKMGEGMKDCFQSFAKEMNEKTKEAVKAMDPKMRECIKKELGDNIFGKIESGDIDQETGSKMSQVFNGCANSTMPEIPAEAKACLEKEYGVGFVEKMKSGQMTPPANFQGKVQSCMSSGINGKILGQMPPEIAECVKEILEKEKIDMSDQSKIEGILKSKVQECAQKMMGQ